jgi:formate dehydrogenase subunit gamma
MMHGWVSRAWAKKHHELWYRDVTGDTTRDELAERPNTKKG